MFRYLRRSLNATSNWPGFTRVGKSVYRRLSMRPSNHTGHIHTGTSHRILVEMQRPEHHAESGRDLLRRSAIHHSARVRLVSVAPGQCNMYNNASYRRFNVSGTTSFSFFARWIHGANGTSNQCLDRSNHQSDRTGAGSRWSCLHRLQSDGSSPPASGIMNTRSITRISIVRSNPSVCRWDAGSR